MIGREGGRQAARWRGGLTSWRGELMCWYTCTQPYSLPRASVPPCSPVGHHEAPGLVLLSTSPSASPSFSLEHGHSPLASLVCNLSTHPSPSLLAFHHISIFFPCLTKMITSMPCLAAEALALPLVTLSLLSCTAGSPLQHQVQAFFPLKSWGTSHRHIPSLVIH